jgi:uncharacterized protein YjbJ (UPF0337 family)
MLYKQAEHVGKDPRKLKFQPWEGIMNDDQLKGPTSNTKSQVKDPVGRPVRDKSSESKDKVQKVVGKTHPGYGDLRSDLQRLWVIF